MWNQKSGIMASSPFSSELPAEKNAVVAANEVSTVDAKQDVSEALVPGVFAADADHKLTWWEKVEEIVWDGGNRTKEEKRIVQQLDIYLM